MKEKDLEKLLIGGAAELGLSIDEDMASKFLLYLKELKSWASRINLTTVDTGEGIVTRHFLDSLTPFGFITQSKRLLDVGAGAGFPGLPLKIVCPEIELTLIDSVEKKVHFMRHVIRTLGLKGASAVAARVEERGFIEKNRGSFDCVTSRAFTELGRFLSLAEPLLEPGGRVVAIKGPGVAEELKNLKKIAGLAEPELHTVKVPFEDRVNTIIVVKKG